MEELMGIRYVHVEKLDGGRIAVYREVDGQEPIDVIILPLEVFSLRAGEYGLDPVADADAIWDMILHEGQLPDGAEILITTEPTLEGAAQKHLARCREIKNEKESRPRNKNSKPGPNEQEIHKNVLQTLRDHCPHDPELVALARESMKAAVRHEQAKPRDTRSSIEQTKDRLRGHAQDRARGAEKQTLRDPVPLVQRHAPPSSFQMQEADNANQ
jgi:hypothetical protein